MSMKTEYRYTERDVENAIKKYPKEFLGKDFSFVAQQLPLFNLRPDLVFKDKDGQIVIVEIQMGSLDFNHIYKVLGYKDLYELKYSEQNVQILLVLCGALAFQEKVILEKRGIKCIVFFGDEFVKKAKALGIRLHRVIPHLSVFDLLQKVKREKAQNNLDIDALVFYIDRYAPNEKYLYDYTRNLREIKKYPARWHLRHNDSAPRCQVPWELIISPKILETTSVQVRRICSILEFVTKYTEIKPGDETIILGYRTVYDDFGFERYLEGRKLLFEDICRAYDKVYADWDFELLKKDLEYLQNLKIYCGKYPNFTPQTIFKKFSIKKGLGVLEGNWEREVDFVSQIRPDEVEELKSRHEHMYAKPFWLLQLKTFDYELAELLLFMFRMLMLHYHQTKIDMRLHRWDNRFLIFPKHIKSISRSTLRQTSHYFIHYAH